MWSYLACGIICYFIGMIHSAYFCDRYAASIFREALEIIRGEREEMEKKIEWKVEMAKFDASLNRKISS